MTTANTQAIPFKIRHSKRARRILLKVLPFKGVEVVLPDGYDPSLAKSAIRSKEAWLRSALDDFERKGMGAAAGLQLPDQIALLAVRRTVMVSRLGVPPGTARLEQPGPDELLLSCAGGDEDLGRQLLQSWLKQQGRRHLVPRLQELAEQEGFSYAKTQIRNQRCRWGSCSSRGSISLNCKLLFLPAELVRYVLLHELCHTRHLNHSKEFWKSLESIEPRYRELDTATNLAWRFVPAWAEVS